MSNPVVALADFLYARMSVEDLDRLVRVIDVDVLGSIRRGTSHQLYAYDVADALWRRGYLDEAFFRQLAAVRRQFTGEIEVLAEGVLERRVTLPRPEAPAAASGTPSLEAASAAPNTPSDAPEAPSDERPSQERVQEGRVQDRDWIRARRRGRIVVELSVRMEGARTTTRARASVGGQLLDRTTTVPSPSIGLGALVDQLRDAPDDGELGAQVGEGLGAILFADGAGEVFLQARAGATVSRSELLVRLDLDEPSRALPWEMTHAPALSDFLALERDVFLVRSQGAPAISYRARPPSQHRLLLAVGDAGGLPLVEAEARRVEQSWADSGGVVRVVRGATPIAIRDAAGDDPWTVLHFVGHGDAGRLKGADGWFEAALLRRVLQGRVATAAYLSVCHGATPDRRAAAAAPDVAWRSTASLLSMAGIPHTIATGAALGDEDGLRAATAWHTSFLKSGDPTRATGDARFTLTSASSHAFAFLLHLAQAPTDP